MDLKVFWTATAQYQLEDIFDYYKNKSNLTTAKKIINQIIVKTQSLEHQPNLGQIESLLKDRAFQYRYLVDGNYKIIYRIEGNYIVIVTVFDCRQNPDKLQHIIK